MRTGKKGVSEVVAAMLLITITIAAATIFYVYSSGLLGSLTGAQPQSGQYSNSITLEFYDWTTLTTLNLTVRNVGSGLANIAAYYVSGTKVTASGACTSTTTLQPQKSCLVKLTIPAALNGQTVLTGVAYLVKVVTKDGGIFVYSCIAGQRTGNL
ncbi:MAG: archaellin/type IV pilin N-terminal domain-containing protein [Candidatus Bathyarchaeia archaeon]